MKIFQIFFLLILLLGINSQINNNPINNTIKVINNINKTNDDINVLHRNDVVQNEEIKNAKKLINNTKIENVKIEYVSQDNPEKGQIKTNKEQVKTTTEQIKNQNIEKKENIQEQDKIINPNPNQNQQKNQQKKEEQEDAINNQTQKQNNDQPKKEEKEKDKKINDNNNNNNKAQKNNQQKNIDKGKEQNQKQNQNQNNSQQNLNYTQSNRTENDKDKQNEKNKLKEKVIKPDPEKVFNLTESLINFFKETFGAKSNETKTETETEEEKKRKQVEEETKKRLEAEREKKRKEELAKLNKTFEEIISMHIPKGEKETLYLDLDSFKKIYIAVTTSDLDLNEKFNFFFSGPNARGRTAAIYQIYNKNYLFWEYETLRKGEFIAEITNKGTKDNDLVFFFGKYEEKKKDRIDTEKIDKISMLLNDIDSNVNQIRNKKSIEIKQANSHNEKVTKNNKWIVIYSIIEIITMSLVFLIQSCYINSLVKAL